MRKTFICNESILITIPIGNVKDVRGGQLMPENFHCVFKDNFKVFVIKGKPKPAGVAQAVVGVFLLALGLINPYSFTFIMTLPSVVFVISGMLTYAAGKYPNMHVTKLSFSLNIISFLWSLAAFCFIISGIYWYLYYETKVVRGILVLILSLFVVECLITLFLIFWQSKAVCREHYNTLPTILLKETDTIQ